MEKDYTLPDAMFTDATEEGLKKPVQPLWDEDNSPRSFPVLPLRGVVFFPNMVLSLFIERKKSQNALKYLTDKKYIVLLTQQDEQEDNPTEKDLYMVGTLCKVLQFVRLADGAYKALVEGIQRVKVLTTIQGLPCFMVTAEPLLATDINKPKTKTMLQALRRRFDEFMRLNRAYLPPAMGAISKIADAESFADAVCAHLHMSVQEKQNLLAETSFMKRLQLIFAALENEINILKMDRQIRSRVKSQMEKSQREYYLNEQMKAIQKELDDVEGGNELQQLEQKIKQTPLSKEAAAKAKAELKKLSSLGAMSAEAGVIRGYLDWLLALPWEEPKPVKIDLKKAQRILDADHYGLEKVKERIIEFLAVQQKAQSHKGSILCLVGPPGVGKTSLGQSIAKATSRTFVRASLGGMKDEAEIRGHRRTYLGALPGRIIQSMKKAKTRNTLFLLDEIDKVGADWRGDPSSALLEVLDPEQNATFSDHYLEVDYDLSPVMFVTTANTLKMAKPLLDRMEIIELSGYTEEEKLQIALRHLLPKQMKLANVSKKEFSLSVSAIRKLIREYTREAGVRQLEREIANLVRKAVKALLSDEAKKISITDKDVEKYAGVPKYSYGLAEKKDQVGVVTGLAWTEAGGDILAIEASVMPGTGKSTLTGHLGDVMKESVLAALSYIRSHHKELGIDAKRFAKNDVHVHVPEGATPKDGPSAGIAMCTTLVSAFTGIPVRKDIAMTGEITLRGRILPIGGLKEKLLAARRSGIKTVLIPKENKKDLAEIPELVTKELKIICVDHITDVLKYALAKPLSCLK